MDPVITTDALHDLGALALELNAASDKLNEAIEEVEDRLQQTKIGVTAWIRLDDAAAVAHSSAQQRELGFAKLGDEWRIVVRDKRSVWPHPQPLLKAARSDRVLALPRLPELVAALVTAARTMLADIDQAQAQARRPQ